MAISNTILVLASHPDDEILGCGGTMAKYAALGARVHVAFLADGVSSRDPKHSVEATELDQRRAAAKRACEILGVSSPIFGDLPDNKLDTVPLLQITQMIEKWITEYQPDTIFTHHIGDLNIDHQRTHQATVTACRPQKGLCVKSLLFFEIASSTEWQMAGSAPHFAPNWFEDISTTYEKKKQALQCYAKEMRQFPHPRSLEGVEALAKWRGASAGFHMAEAFILGRQLK